MSGGTVTSVGGKSRRGVAALDASSGAATHWDANVDRSVAAIVLAGSTVYLGGEFDAIGGETRSNLGAVDAHSGAPKPWDPRADAAVNVLAPGAVAGRLLVGGAFHTVGAFRREGLATLSLDGSQVLPWTPPISGTVRSFLYAPGQHALYFGGRFTFQTDKTLHSLGVITPGDVTTPWGGIFNSFVSALALAPDEQTLYVGGAFSTVQSKTRKRLAALDETGALTTWNVGADAGHAPDRSRRGCARRLTRSARTGLPCSSPSIAPRRAARAITRGRDGVPPGPKRAQ